MKTARGDVRQILIGIYQTLERCGGKDIVARARVMARAGGYRFSDRECTVWLKAFQEARARGFESDSNGDSVHARETHEKRTENARSSKHKTHEKRTRNARETHSRANNESLITNLHTDTNVSGDANKNVTEQATQESEPELAPLAAEDENRIRLSIAFAATENKSGTMTPSRAAGLRHEMQRMLAEVGADRWRYGVDEANGRGKPWQYAKAIIAKHPTVPERPSNVTPLGSRNGARRPGYADRPISPERQAAIRRLEQGARTVWAPDELPATAKTS